jgi:phosphoglycolate phosphatase-like HAD superfamily hydrolase
MSGGLFTNQLLRETGLEISAERVERLRQGHASAYQQQASRVRPLPGARELLSCLSNAGILCSANKPPAVVSARSLSSDHALALTVAMEYS